MKENENISILKSVLEYVIWIAAVILLTWFLITFVIQKLEVNGSSMVPTLENGDQLMMEKVSYRFGDPERFDIVVFPYAYQEKTYFIKRVIGLPGETVQIDMDGNIYIDGEILEEDYGAETIEYPGLALDPITLGEDEYFVLGDNRNNSEDSRFPDVGNIRRDEIMGRAFIRLFPLSKFGFVD